MADTAKLVPVLMLLTGFCTYAYTYWTYTITFPIWTEGTKEGHYTIVSLLE